MISLDSGDKIQGDAATAAKIDYTISGLDNNAIKQLADGQLSDSTGDLYTADSADVVATITLVNTHTSALTCNLYLTPSGGTARRIIPKDLSLGIGYSLHTDGKEVVIVSPAGGVQSAYVAHASSHTDGTDDIRDATDSLKGIVELAIASEVNTGTSTSLAVTPDALAGSIHGRKTVYIKVLANDTALETGDGLAYFTVPSDLNGMNLVDADAVIYTVSSSGEPSFQIHNLTDASDMLSTNITIDVSEFSSYTADPQPVINTDEDDVVTGDRIRIDCDSAGTDVTGLDIILVFATP